MSRGYPRIPRDHQEVLHRETEVEEDIPVVVNIVGVEVKAIRESSQG